MAGDTSVKTADQFVFTSDFNGLSFIVCGHGLKTPNEGTNQRNMKFWASVADKYALVVLKRIGSGSGYSVLQRRQFPHQTSVVSLLWVEIVVSSKDRLGEEYLVFSKNKQRWLCAQKIYKMRQTKLSQLYIFL